MVACAAHADMCAAWMHVTSMGKMAQIRNMPDAIHRKVKARAAQEGMSLSDYLLREIRKSAERPTMAELVERLASLPPVITSKSPAEIVREGREERMRELDRLADSRRRRR
jgi:antitoxin FitA